MHETLLVAGLVRKVAAVARENGAGRVTAVRVRLGAFSHLSPDHFAEHFAIDAAGTVAEGARLDVEIATDEAAPDAQDIRLLSVDVDD